MLKAGIAMSSALQPGNAKRTMLSESIFDAVPACQLYLAEICSLLVPCVSEALSLVNPDARYAHTMTMFVAICQLAEQPGVQTVEAQNKHTDVKKVRSVPGGAGVCLIIVVVFCCDASCNLLGVFCGERQTSQWEEYLRIGYG